MKWQPLADPNVLLDHALLMVEIKSKAVKLSAPFYGIVKLPEACLFGFGEFGEDDDAELLDADGAATGYTVADISRWMPFDPKEHE